MIYLYVVDKSSRFTNINTRAINKPQFKKFLYGSSRQLEIPDN